IVLDPETDARRAGLMEHIVDAYESRLALRRMEAEERWREPLVPNSLYLSDKEWERQLATRTIVSLAGEPTEPAVPRFAEASNATEAFRRYVEERLAAGERVVLAAGTAADLRFLGRVTERELDIRPERLPDWDGAVEGSVGTLMTEFVGGFVYNDVTVVAFADLMGVRARQHT